MYEIEDEKIIRVIVIGDERILVQISSPQSDQLFIRFLGRTRTDSTRKRAAVINYIYDWFDLHTNLKPFYDMALKNPLLKQTIKKSYGLRIVGIPDLFEALCWGILGQQIMF